ncbi:hypothetical protein L9F63_018032, partial [Diploptera punctata]
MANSGRDDNGSQFFFTLAAAPELQNKHTIFAKVTGETVFNMLKLEDALVDQEDKPLYAQKIIKTEILYNPFPDIVPRTSPEQKPQTEEKKTRRKKDINKNFKLLSFGEEAEEDEEEVMEVNRKFSGRSKSTHDLLNDPKLSAEPAVQSEMNKRKQSESSLSGDEDAEHTSHNTSEQLDQIRKKLKSDRSNVLHTTEENKTESSQQEDKNKKVENQQMVEGW